MNDKYREPLVYPDGTFFCLGCLETLSQELQSTDPRYCRECCERLLAEYENGTDRLFPPGWVPKVSPVPPKATEAHCKRNLAHKKLRQHPMDDVVLFNHPGAGEKGLQRRLL